MANAAHVSGCLVAVKHLWCGCRACSAARLSARALTVLAALVGGTGGNGLIGAARSFVGYRRGERPRREQRSRAACQRVGKCRISGFTVCRGGARKGLRAHLGNQSAQLKRVAHNVIPRFASMKDMATVLIRTDESIDQNWKRANLNLRVSRIGFPLGIRLHKLSSIAARERRNFCA